MKKIPIYHHTDDTLGLFDLDIDADFEDMDIRYIYFFNINAVSEYMEDGRQMSQIHSNGTTFICPWNIDKLLKHLND